MCQFWLFLWKQSHSSKTALLFFLFQMEKIKHANKKVEKMRCDGDGEINKRKTSSHSLLYFKLKLWGHVQKDKIVPSTWFAFQKSKGCGKVVVELPPLSSFSMVLVSTWFRSRNTMVQNKELALGNKFLLVRARSSKLCNVAEFIFIALPILIFGIYSCLSITFITKIPLLSKRNGRPLWIHLMV